MISDGTFAGVFLPALARAHPVSIINMVSEQIGRWGKQKSLRLSHTAGLALTESPWVPASLNGRPESNLGVLRVVRWETRYEKRFMEWFWVLN
jgi:hypothetical protein